MSDTMITPAGLPAPDTVIDYGNGSFGPLMIHWATEGCDVSHIIRDAGFDCRWLLMGADLDDTDPIFVDYFEHGAAASEILPRWRPTDQGDGWKLVGKHDSEDGPVALFIRPIEPATKDA